MTDEEKKSKQTDEKKEAPKKKPQKFKFECTKCGQCCQNRDDIPVTFTDLAGWTKQGALMNIVLPHLELASISTQDELSKIAIVPYVKMQDVDENGKGTCPFYDKDNKICNIYFAMPINCKTFPLSYSGEKFFVSDPTCPGIGKGNMTKEDLLEMRKTAMADYNQRADTSIAMVPLQGLFIRHFMKQSQASVEKLSEDDKKKLDELIKKSQDSPEEPDAS